LRYIKLNMGYWGCGFPKRACIDWGRALTREIGYTASVADHMESRTLYLSQHTLYRLIKSAS
jgi:hypothetical protein